MRPESKFSHTSPLSSGESSQSDHEETLLPLSQLEILFPPTFLDVARPKPTTAAAGWRIHLWQEEIRSVLSVPLQWLVPLYSLISGTRAFKRPPLKFLCASRAVGSRLVSECVSCTSLFGYLKRIKLTLKQPKCLCLRVTCSSVSTNRCDTNSHQTTFCFKIFIFQTYNKASSPLALYIVSEGTMMNPRFVSQAAR